MRKMTTLTSLCTVALFSSGDRRHRIAIRFSHRSQFVATLESLSISRHSLTSPNERKGRRRSSRRGVRAEEELLGGSRDLEAEIYRFMEKSPNPRSFPSRKDLVAAGREDLAKAIAMEGGWLAYGWDSGEKKEDANPSNVSDWTNKRTSEEKSGIFQHRMISITGEAHREISEECFEASPSGRSMNAEVSQDAGIDGIISRLEKERSLAFGFGSPNSKEAMAERGMGFSTMIARHGSEDAVESIESTGRCASSNLGENLNLHSSGQNSHFGSSVGTNSNSDPSAWRAWSIQRSGDPIVSFEAAEIVPEQDLRKSNLNFIGRHLLDEEKEKVSAVSLTSGDKSGSQWHYDNNFESLKKEISVSLQHLESQLTSALQLLQFRSNRIQPYEDDDPESLLKQLHRLSDALECQQNEIKKARDILRSTKAKLAVMEGKIVLEVIKSQKIHEEKQIRLVGAGNSPYILRPVYIVWPNSASEVLLAGSFDGWTSQRRMEKNELGVFYLCLRLYPGRYEIKFVVDGVWSVDPLRPLTKNNCFENNLLMVT